MTEDELREMLGRTFDQGAVAALAATLHVLPRRHRGARKIVAGIHARLTERASKSGGVA